MQRCKGKWQRRKGGRGDGEEKGGDGSSEEVGRCRFEKMVSTIKRQSRYELDG